MHWPSCMGWVDEAKRAQWVDGTGKSVVAALEQAKAAGKIKAYGVCNMGTADLGAWRESGGSLATNQLPYNLLWRCIERAIVPACSPALVLAYSPLQQGLLSGRVSAAAEVGEGRRRTRLFRGNAHGGVAKAMHGGAGHEALLDGPAGALAALKAIAERAGLTVPELSLAWLLAQPGVGCVIAGASSPAQVRQNAAAAAVRCDAATLDAATAATAELKAAMEAEGNVVDMYAALTRIHGS